MISDLVLYLLRFDIPSSVINSIHFVDVGRGVIQMKEISLCCVRTSAS